MAENIFGPREAADVKSVTDRPAFTPTAEDVFRWFKDCDPGDPESGTKAEAGFFNFIIANLREAVVRLGVPLVADDDLLVYKCFQAVMAPPATSSTNFGEARLVKSGSNIVLQRFNGFRLMFPSGEVVPLPIAGASLAATGLTPATLYYVYAYKSGSEVALEASVTGYTVHAGTGIKHKTGAELRVLVGMVYIDTGPVFRDEDGKRWVLSYFNRRRRSSKAQLTSGVTSGTGSNYVSLHASLQNYFLTWGDEEVDGNASWKATAGIGSEQNPKMGVLFDVTSAASADNFQGSGNATLCGSFGWRNAALAEGLHYATLALKTTDGYTFSIASGAAGATWLTVHFMG